MQLHLFDAWIWETLINTINTNAIKKKVIETTGNEMDKP